MNQKIKLTTVNDLPTNNEGKIYKSADSNVKEKMKRQL